jgi:hypothetical protein
MLLQGLPRFSRSYPKMLDTLETKTVDHDNERRKMMVMPFVLVDLEIKSQTDPDNFMYPA